MKRRECLAAILPELSDCAVVTIMGAVAAELHSLGHRPSFFYLQHAMGLAPSIGLGIALTQPERRVGLQGPQQRHQPRLGKGGDDLEPGGRQGVVKDLGSSRRRRHEW
jgi:hypothetical protein